ncbi:arylsulfatase A-like enzyme [Prosthecobacter fusiformis]|uniref:Arylsulfatase A-like enzyme n=1 Tax=Prosthecobacter fusiformis TaxID=48464 RepID=A0A4V3FI50_9BACT|nr:sulfatase-like hydrolase/transferase [Prosthecobacter fusiformis]TDU81043.1 arylsulfatase A-like enzyme [Prosthecobacter fusiformis]
MKSRRWLLLLACLFSASTVLAAPQPPNILFIFTDDHSYKTLSCYPEAMPGVKTPAMDALAARGIRFSHAYMGAWCMPSRATMLTGRHPHGIESMRMSGKYPGSVYDPQQTPFFPAVFRQHGYNTAHIGKWHTGIDSGFGRDWDYQIVWNRPKYPENAGAYYEGQILEINGVKADAPNPDYSTDNYTRWASEYIRGQHRDPAKPWFLWLCYGGVHGPTTPAKRHKGLHKDDPVTVPADILAPRPGKPEYLDKTQAWKKDNDGRIVPQKSGETFGDNAKKARPYEDHIHQLNDCTQSLDEGVAEVLKALKESGQLENTLVVLTADQGFATGEHGLRTKLAPYDASYRSPLIISMPGTLPEGKVCTKPVHGTDLVATFSAFAGITLPWELHGRDLTPLLKDPTGAAWPYPCFYEATGNLFGSDVTQIMKTDPAQASYHDVPWYAALNDGRYKYIRYLTPGETEELYDLQADPEELVNLADSPAHRATLEKLRTATVDELRRTRAGYADNLPPTRQMQAAAKE